jgi:hypothetical protein
VVEFDLSDADPEFQRDIPAILLPLTRRYPGAELRSVGLYDPRPGDTSMGATHPGGRIELNSYWFSRHPRHLRSAAEHHAVVDVGGVPMGWHGPMVWEPEQLLTHEFGHVAWQSLPQRTVRDWAGDRWSEATRVPHLAPSGYALTSPDEFFGEMFALVHLGYATEDEARDLRDLLEGLR